MSVNKIGKAGLTLVALSTSLILAGCSSPASPANANDRFTQWSGVEKEFSQTVKSFPKEYLFPRGVPTSPALDSLIAPPKGTDEVFERGTGLGYFYMYWECAWMRVILSSDVTSSDATEGITMLTKGLHSEFRRRYYVDPDHVWERQVIGGAKVGDLSTMREFFTSDCSALAKPL